MVVCELNPDILSRRTRLDRSDVRKNRKTVVYLCARLACQGEHERVVWTLLAEMDQLKRRHTGTANGSSASELRAGASPSICDTSPGEAVLARV